MPIRLYFHLCGAWTYSHILIDGPWCWSYCESWIVFKAHEKHSISSTGRIWQSGRTSQDQTWETSLSRGWICRQRHASCYSNWKNAGNKPLARLVLIWAYMILKEYLRCAPQLTYRQGVLEKTARTVEALYHPWMEHAAVQPKSRPMALCEAAILDRCTTWPTLTPLEVSRTQIYLFLSVAQWWIIIESSPLNTYS